MRNTTLLHAPTILDTGLWMLALRTDFGPHVVIYSVSSIQYPASRGSMPEICRFATFHVQTHCFGSAYFTPAISSSSSIKPK